MEVEGDIRSGGKYFATILKQRRKATPGSNRADSRRAGKRVPRGIQSIYLRNRGPLRALATLSFW
jgi:hypothetical protein